MQQSNYPCLRLKINSVYQAEYANSFLSCLRTLLDRHIPPTYSVLPKAVPMKTVPSWSNKIAGFLEEEVDDIILEKFCKEKNSISYSANKFYTLSEP